LNVQTLWEIVLQAGHSMPSTAPGSKVWPILAGAISKENYEPTPYAKK